MNVVFSEFVGIAQSFLTVIFVVFLRVGTAVSLVPGFGENSLPARVKLALSVLMAFALAPLVATDAFQTGALTSLMLLQEVGLGLALGLSMRLFIFALQIAGAIAAQATSLSQLFSSTSAEASPAIGNVMYISALALAMTLDLPEKTVSFFVLSYDAFPVGADLLQSGLADWGIGLLSQSFQLAFVLAAPFLTLSLIYNLALGVINRAMPQLMVAFVGAPLITALGILFCLLFMPAILLQWWAAFANFVELPRRLLP